MLGACALTAGNVWAQTATGSIAPIGATPDDTLPGLTEEQAKNIASRVSGIAAVLADHDELERHATYDRDTRVWTVFWTLPGNFRRLMYVEVSDPGGAVLTSHIEAEAYLDVIPTMSEQEAIDLASGEERVMDALEGREADPNATYGDDMIWTVSFFNGTNELAQVLIDDDTGSVNEVMVGPQVAWQMARGYKGAFGRIINEPYVWLPLCSLFVLPFINFRRLRSMVHLDLLVLLSFTVSHYFFNRGEIDISVPLAYPTLMYIFLRMGWIGFARRRRKKRACDEAETPKEEGPDRSGATMPHINFRPAIMLAALTALIIFRLVINFADSNVVDVGYSGVIGAHRILEGQTPYGHMPSDNANGDTYGPFNYLVYVPFEGMMRWSGEWDDLPAAHGAAIFFDLVTTAGMYAAGRRLMRGRREGHSLGLALAFAWVAYPYSTFVQNCNVNDTIVAAFLVWGFVFLSRAPVAGFLLGLAAQIKFFPLVLAPLWASFPRAFFGWGRRALFLLALAFAIVVTIPVIFMGDGSFQTFWERSIEWQIGRDSPFSIWGQSTDRLAGLQRPMQYLLVAVAAISFAIPPRKNLIQMAALTAALIVGFQMVQTHWFYLYIPWFAPLALIAVLAGQKEKRPARGEIDFVGNVA